MGVLDEFGDEPAEAELCLLVLKTGDVLVRACRFAGNEGQYGLEPGGGLADGNRFRSVGIGTKVQQLPTIRLEDQDRNHGVRRLHLPIAIRRGTQKRDRR